MKYRLHRRQRAVKWDRRTPAGRAFNDFVDQVIQLTRYFTTSAEALTKPCGQTMARWLILRECTQGATIADIARHLRLARQSVQRVADDLVTDKLCTYEKNPRHRRAKLLRHTTLGRNVLAAIDVAQRAWTNEMGKRFGLAPLRDARRVLATILEALGQRSRSESESHSLSERENV